MLTRCWRPYASRTQAPSTRVTRRPATAPRSRQKAPRASPHIEVVDRPQEAGAPLTSPGSSGDLGYSWGNQTVEAFRLASAILADAVGDPPPEAVAGRFLHEVVSHFRTAEFQLGVDEVNDWLLENRLFVEAELAAHRGDMLPQGPALAVTPDDVGPGQGIAEDEPLHDPATASALIAACEQAWAEIRRHHPDVPHAVVVLGSGVERGRLVKLGHWWGGRWLLHLQRRTAARVAPQRRAGRPLRLRRPVEGRYVELGHGAYGRPLKHS